MIPLPTPAELRVQASAIGNAITNMPLSIAAAMTSLRQLADLIEQSEKGVTEEVVFIACDTYDSIDDDAVYQAMRAALIAVAPHLALMTKDSP